MKLYIVEYISEITLAMMSDLPKGLLTKRDYGKVTDIRFQITDNFLAKNPNHTKGLEDWEVPNDYLIMVPLPSVPVEKELDMDYPIGVLWEYAKS